jgi:5-methylcytosine-specific restriction enzyme A
MADDQPTENVAANQPASADMAAYKRAWRAKHKAAGLCTSCGAARDTPGRVRCAACLGADKAAYQRQGRDRYRQRAGRQNAGDRAERARWAAEGLCTWCGGPKDIPDRKRCSGCKEATDRYNAVRYTKRRNAGLCVGCGKAPRPGTSRCQACHDVAKAEYRTLMARRRAGGVPPCPPTLVCLGCGDAKPAEAFALNRKNATGRNGQCRDCRHAFYEANRTRIRDKAKRRRQENRDGLRAKARAAWSAKLAAMSPEERQAWRQKEVERKKAYIEAHPERHRENARRASARWREAHPEEAKAVDQAARVRREQRLLVNGGDFTGAEWRALKQTQGFACLACGRKEPEIRLSVDHVVPVSKGGSNDISNIQAICLPCNLRKHAKHIDYRPG